MFRCQFHKRRNDCLGYSLIEIIIAITISVTIMSAVYQMFHSQQNSYFKQDHIVEAQQNIRATMALLTKNMQLAGFDPSRNAKAEIVQGFDSPHDSFSINYDEEKDIIAFTIDIDESGDIEDSRGEKIAFRLDGSKLQRYNEDLSEWELLSDNIDALDFVYLDQNGIRTYDSDSFRAVEVTLLARIGGRDENIEIDKVYLNRQGENICPNCSSNNFYRRRLLTKTIQFRNMGL